MQDDVLDNFYKIADATFRMFAEQAATENVTIEEALEESWFLYERGFLRLVTYDEGLRLVPSVGQSERRAAAKHNATLSGYRRSLLGDGPPAAEKHPAWVWVQQIESDAGIPDKTARIACAMVENCTDGDVFMEGGVPPSTSLLGYSDRAVRVAFGELERGGHMAFDDGSQTFRPQLLPELTGEELMQQPPEAQQAPHAERSP